MTDALASNAVHSSAPKYTMVLLHQCMDKEWKAWGKDSAEEFAKCGFTVVRVRTLPWRDLKAKDPFSSRLLFPSRYKEGCRDYREFRRAYSRQDFLRLQYTRSFKAISRRMPRTSSVC